MKETKTKTLTQERLRELLHYDPETGVFTWKVQTSSRSVLGSVAGTHRNGYIRISVDKKLYSAHRLVFLYMVGEFPGTGLNCDHLNHVRDDNRWGNLRIVTPQNNSRNRSMVRDNTSGFMGVSWCKTKKRWIAHISANGKLKTLGTFKDKNDAIKARKNAEIEHGYHPNHGKGKSKY